MKFLKFSLAGALAIAALASCGEKEETGPDIDVTGGGDAEFAAAASISSSDPAFTPTERGGTINFDGSGGEVSVSVDCGVDWTFTDNASDIFSVAADIPAGVLTVSALRNSTGSKLYGTVLLMTAAGRIQFAALSLVQEPYVASPIGLETDSWSAPASAASVTIGVECEYDWAVDPVGTEWLTAEKIGSDALTLSVAENPDRYSRSARVELTCSDGEVVSHAYIQVTQDPAPYVLLGTSSLSVDGEADTYDIAVETNALWTASSDCDWIGVEGDGSLLRLSLAENTGGLREGSVTVTAGGGLSEDSSARIVLSQTDADASLVLVYKAIEGDTITLPLAGTVDCSVIWGDGSVSPVTEALPSHTYSETGTYRVRVCGTVTSLSHEDIASASEPVTNLIAVDRWGLTGLNRMYFAFAYCPGLKTIPDDTAGSFAGVTTFEDAFGDCIALEAIPARLLSHASKASSFFGTFDYCTSVKEIPAGLFDNCTAASSMMFTFEGCTGLTEIPAGLFDRNVKVTSFFSVFAECSGIREIPEHLFDRNTANKSFKYSFFQTSITSIPEELFRYNTELTDVFSCFEYCTLLTEIPPDLFKYNTKITDFSAVFSNCSMIRTIPEGLFSRQPDAERFQSVFQNCKFITEIPAGLFASCPKATMFNGAFNGDIGLTSVPESLFANCPKAANFSAVFQGCTGLTTVPVNVFAACPDAANFSYAFAFDEGLTEIPAGVFDHNRKATDFSDAFVYCARLASESPYTVLSDGTKVHLYQRAEHPDEFTAPKSYFACFRYCTELEDLPSIPSGWL